MKILLIQPPIRDFYETKQRLQPLGLAYLKAVLKKHLPHVDVKICDFHSNHGRQTIPLPDELKHLNDFYRNPDKSPFSTFHHFYHFGATYDQIAEEVSREQPDLVGISANFTPYYQEVLETARAIKCRLNVPIVVGGSHASCHPESLLECDAIDFVVQGEGEGALVRLVDRLSKQRPVPRGILSCMKNDDISNLPFPDISDFDLNDYTYEGKPLAMMITSRGCPHQCSFCSVHSTFGTLYRRRSNESIVDEMKLRYASGYRVFDFEDDNLSLNRSEFQGLCRLITATFSKQDIILTAMNGISYAHLDESTLQLMRSAGFQDLNLSLVSSCPTTLKTTQRGHTREKFVEVVTLAHRLGFRVLSSQILGLPNETLDDMIDGLIVAARLPVLIGVSPFYLIPGSTVAQEMKKTFNKSDLVQARLTNMGVDQLQATRADIYTLFVAARIINFIKSFEFSTQMSPGSLNEALKFGSSTPREKAGKEILQILFSQRLLNAWTGDGFLLLSRFKPDLFFRLWERLGIVQTRQGKKIMI